MVRVRSLEAFMMVYSERLNPGTVYGIPSKAIPPF